MAAKSSAIVSSRFTPTRFPYFLLIFPFSIFSTPILGINVTAVLSSYSDLSEFTNLLSATAVSSDLASRASLTILAVPNSYLRSSSNPNTSPSSSTSTLADVVRYHVILQFLTWSSLRQIPPSGTLFTTLYQTTGRATNNFGCLNVTFNPSNGVVSLHPPTPNPGRASALVLSLIRTIPYNLSIFTVSSLLAPYGFDLMASETRPPPPEVNITKSLIDAHNFNVAASMLTASGVVDEFEADEGGAGITLFVPTDEAFSNLPSTVQLQALPADKKALVLKFHVLHSYYPLGSLESIVNPVQPTLATEDNGAGSFTLNISRVNGSVAINSGIVEAVVTQTVFDQNPVSIFGISNVLLPREIFGTGKGENVDVGMRNGSRGGVGGPPMMAQPPSIGASPESSPDPFTPPSHLSSPPGFREMSSRAAGRMRRRTLINSCLLSCFTFLLLLIKRAKTLIDQSTEMVGSAEPRRRTTAKLRE